MNYFKGISSDEIKPMFKEEHNKEKPTEQPKELSEEDLKKMLEIVSVEEFKLEALKVKYPIIDWEIHTEGGCIQTDADEEVTLIDETQGRNDEDLMFDIGVLNRDAVFEEPIVNTAPTTSSIPVSVDDPVTTAGEVVTTAKPKAITTASTITITTRPKAKRVVVQEPSEFTTTTSPSQASQLPQAKDKGKAIMVEPEKPLKKKDQIAFDEELAKRLVSLRIGRRREACKTKRRRS
ncbi:hypothetical protein Tco_1043605 [Tanacetum coccineum]|uniref:Uncharacterized protein n=1 Tax=Tanacetum coccineum TaxID=301880 RepID=A0ABQ5GMI7_9ASTR